MTQLMRLRDFNDLILIIGNYGITQLVKTKLYKLGNFELLKFYVFSKTELVI